MPKLSVQGCAHAANDPLVEDMLELKKRLRDSSHLAFNFAQAISSIRAHTVPLRSASEAKKLRHIGNYLANQILSILRKRGLLEEQNCGQSFALPNTAPVGTQSELSIRDNLAEIPDRLSRVYAPAYRKRMKTVNYCNATEPWFVLLALQEAQAIHEDAAIPFDVLFKRMLNAGVRSIFMNYLS
ncbi:putative DNA polymerase beta-like domain, DNA polymerase lambda lyase domain superfamily [Plasmopara halstedii]